MIDLIRSTVPFIPIAIGMAIYGRRTAAALIRVLTLGEELEA